MKRLISTTKKKKKGLEDASCHVSSPLLPPLLVLLVLWFLALIKFIPGQFRGLEMQKMIINADFRHI